MAALMKLLAIFHCGCKNINIKLFFLDSRPFVVNMDLYVGRLPMVHWQSGSDICLANVEYSIDLQHDLDAGRTGRRLSIGRSFIIVSSRELKLKIRRLASSHQCWDVWTTIYFARGTAWNTLFIADAICSTARTDLCMYVFSLRIIKII